MLNFGGFTDNVIYFSYWWPWVWFAGMCQQMWLGVRASVSGPEWRIASLNSFLMLLIDTKMFFFKHRWEILNANQYHGYLPILSTFPWIFPHPNFIKNTITFEVSNGVSVGFVHRVSNFTPVSGSTISTSSVVKLSLGSVHEYSLQ